VVLQYFLPSPALLCSKNIANITASKTRQAVTLLTRIQGDAWFESEPEDHTDTVVVVFLSENNFVMMLKTTAFFHI
jgi:hypothetical protein